MRFASVLILFFYTWSSLYFFLRRFDREYIFLCVAGVWILEIFSPTRIDNVDVVVAGVWFVLLLMST
jgi:uncharacterized membrane protein